jgi:hypothetical protein
MNSPVQDAVRLRQSLSVAVPSAREARRARLRAIHVAMGVDDRYLVMPASQRLWFVDVTLDREVHAQALGFTRSLHHYALGIDEAQAIAAVHRYLAAVAPEVAVIKARAKPSVIEHPQELTFPEQVCRDDMPARPLRPREPA